MMLKKTFLFILLCLTTFGLNAANYSSSLLTSKYASWGVNPKIKANIGVDKSWKLFEKKKDIVVAVIDTGIDASHPFLKKNIVGPNTNRKKSSKQYGVDFSTKKVSYSPRDTHGHGTHVSGIIKSIFPEVKILALKYYNPAVSGPENLAATIKALKYAVKMNVDIINYSGGGPESSAAELKILKEAEEKGILIIAAAGNERSNIDIKRNYYYPASYGLSNIITVAAYKRDFSLIRASNWGKLSVDIAAPGKRIKSASPQKKASRMTGTSQATAFVTGVAALIKSNYPKLNSKQIKNIILGSSKKTQKLEGKVLGAGRLDAFAAMGLAKKVFEKTNNLAPKKKAKIKRALALGK